MTNKKVNDRYGCNICSKIYKTKSEAEYCYDGHVPICVCCHKSFEIKECGPANATFVDIDCWYGSKFDGLNFSALVCDDCLEKYIKLVKGERK